MGPIQTKWASRSDQAGVRFRLSGRGIQTKRAGLPEGPTARSIEGSFEHVRTIRQFSAS